MSDIEEEIDFSKFDTKPKPPPPQKNNDGVVVIDETGGTTNADRKKLLIYIIAITILVAGIYIEWRYFYYIPAGPPEDAAIDLSKVTDPAPPANLPGPTLNNAQ